MSSLITAREIEAAARKARASGKDVWLTDDAPRGSGRLAVRCRPNGSRLLVFRYTKPDGTRDALALGTYDAVGEHGLDLTEARRKAGEHVRLLHAGVGDLRQHFSDQENAKQQQIEAEARAAAAARAEADRGTLQQLLQAYVTTLGERPSAREARTLFRLHVVEAFPEIAQTKAALIEPEQIRDVLAKLIEAGKGRTAGKLRAYARAAYALAQRARLDPKVPGTFAGFAVKANPVEPVPALPEYVRALDRVLTATEMVKFWRRLQSAPVTASRDATIAAVLLGGQRPTQLVRVTAADVDLPAGTITLLDPKGRKRAMNPRRHVVPIVDELMPIIKRRHALCQTPDAPLFSSTGEKQLREEMTSRLVREIVADMKAADDLERGAFQMRDLRRTVETTLAAAGISKDVRAQLLSHGISGVQDKHYDRHAYMAEKRHALELLVRRLEGKADNVVPMASRRRTR
jgi:integrase